LRADLRMLIRPDYRDPGAWSRTQYLLGEGVTATASTQVEHIERVGSSTRWNPGCILSTLQHGSATRLLSLPAHMRSLSPWMRISQNDAIMLSAMVTGDRTYLSHTLRVGFERTGSFHMLVVSGFHLAILAACINWLMRRLRVGRLPATLTTIAITLLYALFTGFAAPVQRAFWMVTLYMLGRLVYRERSAPNAIGFAALCLLTASPRGLFDASIQMTLLAVLAIAGLAAPLMARTLQPYYNAARDLELQVIESKLEPKIAEFRILLRMTCSRLEVLVGRWLAWHALPWAVRFVVRAAELFVVSLAVELAMTMPMAIYFHRITLYALPVNMLLLPLLFVLLPAALLTLTALALWPAAAAAPGAITGAALHVGVGMVHLFGNVHMGDIRIAEPTLGRQCAFYVLMALGMILARRNMATAWGSRPLRWLSAACVVVAALLAVLPRAVVHPRDGLLVEMLDVGQGDAILLIAPDGKTMLVDAGGFGGGPRQSSQEFDIGEEVVAPALWARGITRLDVVSLSHAHSDHMGGMPAILRDFHPRELWVGENPLVPSYVGLLREAAELGVEVRSLHAGDELAFGPDRVRVLAPFPGTKPGDEPANNDSLVMRVENGSSSVLLEGDAEWPVEEAMLAEPMLQSTVLKVGHHGSKSSSMPAFLDRVAPQRAAISCGLHNRYGHPSPQTLDALEERHVPTLSTDIEGALCFVLDGMQSRLEPSCAGN
jgi:competence protein ComEC